MTAPEDKNMDELVALCKRRGFVYPASEIYGGLRGFWDYGPLGTALKNNIRDWWWRCMVDCPPIGPDGQPVSIVGLDSAIIQNPKTWEHSGHVGGFNDPMVDDKETKQRFRADKAWVVGFYTEDQMRKMKELSDELAKFGEKISLESELKQDVEAQKKLVDAVEDAVQGLDDEAQSHADFFGNMIEKFEDTLNQYTSIRDTNKDDLDAITAEISSVQRPSFTYAVEADSEEAIYANLTEILPKRILKKTSNYKKVVACSQAELREGWPRLSPATQEETLTEPRAFNLMLDTYPGPIRDEENKAYLRPETAQGIFLNFKNVMDTMRVKVPFGIAQIGKSFRNEVTPRNFIFRSREFEQMEMEFFCPPDESQKWYEFWRDERFKWWLSLGVAEENLILRDHGDDELAHYSSACVDVEYKYPFTAPGYGELEGVAHRGCYDLTAHSKHKEKNRDSNTKLDYFDQELQVRLQNEGVDKAEIKERSRYVPHVIEPASGLTRAVLVLLCEAFTPTPDREGSKYILSFKPKFAPIKAGIFPLVNKDGMPEVATKLYNQLREKYVVEYDAKAAIGRRYARMDEIGTPFCFTIDGDTLTDQTVTVRDRDTLAQERIHLDKVEAFLAEKLAE
ncbi:MAG: glycine--tRNA ligase [Planctomycetota bacterium]